MAGLNPFKLHSFRELRAVMGRAWVTCQPCLRFVELRVRDDRDTRATTFSCCLCGRQGQITFEDPSKQGLQFDPRTRPRRHPDRALRLHQTARLGQSLGHRPPAREDLPQREKPRREPEPRYRLKPLPFTTFGELPALGLGLTAWCSSCRSVRPVEIDDRLAPRLFGRVRFTCASIRFDGRICAGFGHPHVVPAFPVPYAEAGVSLSCRRCFPAWQADQVQLEKPPWSATPIDPTTERYRCPACGGQVTATFHGNVQPGAGSGHHQRWRPG